MGSTLGLIDDGLVKPWPVSLEDGSQIELTVALMGNEKLGEMLVGSEDYSRAEREASNRVNAGTLLLIGIAGNASSPFRQENLALQQGEWTYQVERRPLALKTPYDDGTSHVVLSPMEFIGRLAALSVFGEDGYLADEAEMGLIRLIPRG